MENKVQAEDLLKELTDVIRNAFVATYEREEDSLIMRLVNGQSFCIKVEEM